LSPRLTPTVFLEVITLGDASYSRFRNSRRSFNGTSNIWKAADWRPLLRFPSRRDRLAHRLRFPYIFFPLDELPQSFCNFVLPSSEEIPLSRNSTTPSSYLFDEMYLFDGFVTPLFKSIDIGTNSAFLCVGRFESVSFIGYILFTKSPSCKCVAETGMPYLSRVFQNIQRLFVRYGKSLNMTSICITSIKKAISKLQEDSAQFTTQQKVGSPVDRPDGPVERPDTH